MKGRLAILVGGALVAVAPVGSMPAWGHAAFVEGSVPANSQHDLMLHVPVERDDAVNSRIEVELPEGFEAHSCTADEGWTCTVDNEQAAQVIFNRIGCPAEASWRCVGHPRPGEEHASSRLFAAGPSWVQHHEGDHGGEPPPGEKAPGSPGEAFGFTVHTPEQAGDYYVGVVQRYSNDTTTRWDGPPGSENQAAALKVG